MSQTLDDREKLSRELEDVHNSATALVEKIARAQMALEESGDEAAEALAEQLKGLSQVAEQVESLRSDFDMETARRQNEGEL